MSKRPYNESATALYDAGYRPVLLKPDSKAPANADWNVDGSNQISRTQLESDLAKSTTHNVGVAAGVKLPNGNLFGALDADTEGFVSFLKHVVGFVSGKVGAAGETIFVQSVPTLKSVKLKAKGKKKYGVEFMIDTGMLVVPPSNHPDGMEYRYTGVPLLDVSPNDLPILDETKAEIIKFVVQNPYAWEIVEGGASVQGHDLMLKLTASGVANLIDDLEWLAGCLNELFHPDYDGNTKGETLGMLEDAQDKNLGYATGGKKKPDIIDVLNAEGGNLELFHDPDKATYMTYKNSIGADVTCPINSSVGKAHIRQLFYKAYGKGLSGQAVQDCIGLCEARALHDGKCYEVHLRVGMHGENIYVDLGREDGSVVCITPSGWSIETQCPIKFLRPKGFRPLPIPDSNGNVHLFQKILGLSQESWRLILAHMICALHPMGPYFLLMVEGEHGSGKSFTTACIKNAIDPGVATKAIMPKNERDLMVMASASWLLAFDNLSMIAGSMSDVLCSISTGGGLVGRSLYTNGEPFIMNCVRPVIMNGITSMIQRPDLMDRTIPLFLPALPEKGRKPEAELIAEFNEALPQIIGGLYDIISHALKWQDSIDSPTNIRMADCAKWLVAAEAATGFPEDTFVEAISANQKAFVSDQMLNDPLVLRFLDILKSREYNGTMGGLHKLLTNDMDFKSQNAIGRTPAHLSNRLKRLKSSLSTVGIEFEYGEKTREGKMIHFWLTASQKSKNKALSEDEMKLKKSFFG